MFRFTKNYIFTAIKFFRCSVLSVNPLECVSVNYQERKIRL